MFVKKLMQQFEQEQMALGDTSLVGTGMLGRGLICRLAPTGTSIRRGGMPTEFQCNVELEIHLDDTPTYSTTTRARIPEMLLPQIRPGNTFVAVWVDPDNRSHVTLDLDTSPPQVRMASDATRLKASDILAAGSPCDAVIIEFQSLGMTSPTSGLPMYAFLLTVMGAGSTPYQVQVGLPVPTEAIPLLFPGSRVPAKYVPGQQKETIAIDWERAIAVSARPSEVA